jgi:peptide deformylase
VPGIFETVTRAEKITVKYQDLTGTSQLLECDGLMAICIQHETDHLDGKVFVEYLSNLKQNFIKKKMKKLFK